MGKDVVAANEKLLTGKRNGAFLHVRQQNKVLPVYAIINNKNVGLGVDFIFFN